MVKLATRPTPRAGKEADWDRAEATSSFACHRIGIPFTLNPGEGTFYAPSSSCAARRHRRDWQCGTIQIDYVLPERLDGRIHRRGRQP